MITTKEASLRLGLSDRIIRNYCSKGKLRCEMWYLMPSWCFLLSKGSDGQ